MLNLQPIYQRPGTSRSSWQIYSCFLDRAFQNRRPTINCESRIQQVISPRATYNFHTDIAPPPLTRIFSFRPTTKNLRRIEFLSCQLSIRRASHFCSSQDGWLRREPRHPVGSLHCFVSSTDAARKSVTYPQLNGVSGVKRFYGLLN